MNRILSYLSPCGDASPGTSEELASITSDARHNAAGICSLVDGLMLHIQNSAIPANLKSRAQHVIEDAYFTSIHSHRWAVAVSNKGNA